MDNANPRHRKFPGRLIIFLLAIVGIFFIASLNLKKFSGPNSNENPSENQTGLTNLELPEKAELPEISDSVEIEEKTAKVVYLTFDDGPGPYTAKLLDVLKKYNVKATFFVTGAGDDNLLTREHNEGHAIGLHTFTHSYSYLYSNVGDFISDLYRVQERVKNATGYTSTLMRFPGGSSNAVSASYDGGTHIMSRLVNEVTSLGFTYFDWNVSSGDAGGATTSDEVYTNVIENLKPEYSVVLQHDIKEFSVDAVERIIQYGQKNGYTFNKLDESSFTAHHGVNN